LDFKILSPGFRRIPERFFYLHRSASSSSNNGEAGHGGDIITKDKFGNFELTLDWKVAKGGNSGIFYLAQEIPGEPIWKNSPEMQVLDNEGHPDAKLGIDGDRQAGALYDLIPAEP